MPPRQDRGPGPGVVTNRIFQQSGAWRGHTSAGQATTKPSIAAINLPRDKKFATQGPGVSRKGVKKPLIRYFSRFSMGWVHISIG